ncbi:MAG TPA: tyrosine--tRNA ligase [Candidatus Saccharimonadales bacterium]|nr:tyrosine--tRNA ligase [Candidatus Saccharimonadales bacterium]
MTLSEELQWRGMLKDRTFDDVQWLDTPRTFYLGADPSADSLTIGNLAIYMLARQLAAHGWNAVLLMGGATGLIGDPGGKDEERQLKSKEEIEHNIAGVRAQVERIFSGLQFEVVNNYDWFKDIGYLDFLRDVGKHFSMTELVQRDFIATRMNEGGSGISYAEFSYSLIQGYDFWWLCKNKGVELQIGGSDQWGNMLSGVPLIRKKEGKEVQALSMPLVIDAVTGKKFGKSETGAVWLDPARTSPTQFYQFWINCDDESVEGHLKIYTQLSKEEIEEVIVEHRQNPKMRTAQTRLAQEVTTLVHGSLEMQRAEQVTGIITGKLSVGSLTDQAHGVTLGEIRREIAHTFAASGTEIAQVLVDTDLASSKTEARRLLQDNAISINGQKTQKEQLEESDFQNNRLLIRKGKAFKDSALVERA